MIEVRDVSKRFGRLVALDGVTFTVDRGETVALWGANGAGKTTLLRCVLGLTSYRGSIRVDGLCARREGRAARARIGYVPQRLAFDEERRVAEVIAFVARLRGEDPRTAFARLEALSLGDRLRSPVGTLSGGMRQRLAVAAALVGEPGVLLLDEPSANLDVEARAELLSLLGGLKEGGRTILLTTHRLDEVQRLADRVVVLENGRVAATTEPHGLPQVAGWRTRVILWVDPTESASAAAVLERAGWRVEAKNEVLAVDVDPADRLRPLVALGEAGVSVRDLRFEEGARGDALFTLSAEDGRRV